MEIKLTVVQLDLAKSSEFTRVIEPILGSEGVKLFVTNMEQLVHKSFQSVMTNHSKDEYEIVQNFPGDASRILFKNPDKAYQFVKKLSQNLEEYNDKPNIKKLVFRIGAATGNVDFDQSKPDSDVNKITGHRVCVTVSRLHKAEPGWFYVDKATFDGLSDDAKKNFSEELVKTKEHEDDILAWRCKVISDISISTSSPLSTNPIISRREISKELKKLDSADIIEIARSIDIKEDSLSLDYVINNRGQAISNLLDIAQRRNILPQLKNTIEEYL